LGSFKDYEDFSDATCIKELVSASARAKKGRPKQKVVSFLESYPVPFPSSFIEYVVYDTGLQKRGIAVLLGGE